MPIKPAKRQDNAKPVKVTLGPLRDGRSPKGDPVRCSAGVVLLVASALLGCSTGGQNAKAPIVGTWVLNAAHTSPAAATNPLIANSFTSTLTYSLDGKYHITATFNGQTHEGEGTWRMIGSDVYIDVGQGETKEPCEIRGNELRLIGKNGLDVLVFDRR